MIGKALGVKVQLEQIIGANRIPFLLTNKIDLVISGMGATPERAVQVMFTSPYAALYLGVYGHKATAVSGPDQLGTLRICGNQRHHPGPDPDRHGAEGQHRPIRG